MIGVIIRSVGERTENLCVEAVTRETDQVDLVKNVYPFTEAVRRMIRIAEEKKYEHYLGLDADVILKPGWLQRITEDVKSMKDFFKIEYGIMDRFIRGTAFFGVHIYNSAYNFKMLRALTGTVNTSKPEGNIRHVIKKDHVQIPEPIGYHGFEQWKRDIFNRWALRALRNPEALKRYGLFIGELDKEEKLAKMGWDYGMRNRDQMRHLLDYRNKLDITTIGVQELGELKLTLYEFYKKMEEQKSNLPRGKPRGF